MTEVKELVIWFGIILGTSSFIGGAVHGGIEGECKFKSIITYFNPALRIGCELTKPRF